MIYHADRDKLRDTWQGAPVIGSAEDLFRVSLQTGPNRQIVADTHLFKDTPLRLLPYSDFDSVSSDATGRQYESADAALNDYIADGDVAIAIKHHRCDHRLLTEKLSNAELKEHIKLQDTHIQLAIGVNDRARGLPGVVTLNSPQSYGSDESMPGRFGAADYPMIFVSPEYPGYLPASLHAAFKDNLRTMALAFNAVVKFPGNGRYNGGDPLACFNVEALQQHVSQMLYAVAGNNAQRRRAVEWFTHPDNLIYCAEYAFIVMSAACHWPLNPATVKSLTDTNTANSFFAILESHNNGNETTLTEGNPNKLARRIRASAAPDNLQPLPEYAPPRLKSAEKTKLAFKPFTPADIVDHAIRIHFDREKYGESIAATQAGVLSKMLPGFIEMLGLDAANANPNQKAAATAVFNQIVAVVGKQHSSYQAFRDALQPLLEAAAALTGGRARNNSPGNLFVPPSLFHIVARKEHSGGLLGLSYLGHGLHLTLLRSEE
jgi:hypothetical protein